MTKHYDYIAIGGGSGGIASINRAASYGKKCAIIEAKLLGGTCVNVGCVPKKIMWYGAQIAEALITMALIMDLIQQLIILIGINSLQAELLILIVSINLMIVY